MDLIVATPPVFVSTENFTTEVSILLPDHWQIQKALAEEKDTVSRL